MNGDRLTRVFACRTALGRLRAMPPGVDAPAPERLLCAGRLNAGMVIGAIEQGARRVLVIGCDESACRHENGARSAAAQVSLARRLLSTLGLAGDTVTLKLVDRNGQYREAGATPGEAAVSNG